MALGFCELDGRVLRWRPPSPGPRHSPHGRANRLSVRSMAYNNPGEIIVWDDFAADFDC
jgi:hypothetical protein